MPILFGTALAGYFAIAMALSGVSSAMGGSGGAGNAAIFGYLCMTIAVAAVPVIGYGGGLCIWWPTFRHHPHCRAVLLKFTISYLALLALGMFLTLLSNVLLVALGVLATNVLALIACGVAVIVINRKLAAPSRAGGVVPCPHCGYDMRGQHECRCPECGVQFTVGELVIPPANPYV
ncbi:MAG: hypothetical protein JXB13_06800 [Phycisphaerae bacterium]|nr:hypothetical protein [Phycisphaerae bacterium]